MERPAEKRGGLLRQVLFCCSVIAAGAFIAIRLSIFLGVEGVKPYLFLPVFIFLFAPYVFFGSEGIREILTAVIERFRDAASAAFIIYLLAFYSILNFPLLDASGLLAVVIYLAAPYVWLRSGGGPKETLDVYTAGAILLVWLPVEFGLLPAGYRLTRLLEIDMTLFLFLFVARVRAGFVWALDVRDVLEAFLGFLIFAAFSVPVAVETGFISYAAAGLTPANAIISGAAILFAIAIPEEVFFRGIIQNLLESTLAPKTPKARTIALLITAALFGLAHATSRDWRYVLLASVAGAVYGSVYLRRRKATASAITHMLVDTAWSLLFVTHWKR